MKNEETIKEYLQIIYRNNKKIINVIGLVLVVVAIYMTLIVTTKNDNLLEEVEEKTNVDTFVAKESNEIIDQKVYITGEVNYPGVYTFETGDRIVDIIKYAGGETEFASLESVNLSEIVSDELHIIIPSFEETNDITVSDGKININKATESELTQLNGVGEVTAKNIVKYREANGNFKTIDDVMNVSGIGEKTFEKFKEDIVTK